MINFICMILETSIPRHNFAQLLMFYIILIQIINVYIKYKFKFYYLTYSFL